jgi:hypothetical protein
MYNFEMLKKWIYLVPATLLLVIGCVFVYQYGNFADRPSQESSTGEILYNETESKTAQNTEANPESASNQSSFGDLFSIPTPDREPHIVNAGVKELSIVQCDDCVIDVTIIDHIDGVPDTTIKEINSIITEDLIEESAIDVRLAHSGDLHMAKEINHGIFDFTITYIDHEIVGYHLSMNIFYEGATHYSRGSWYGYFVVSGDQVTGGWVDDLSLFTNNDDDAKDVLTHFFPAGKTTFITVQQEDELASDCLAGYSFPDDFHPSLDVRNSQVRFEIQYPYVVVGPCEGEFVITLPVSEILKRTPQYVPNDSILHVLHRFTI